MIHYHFMMLKYRVLYLQLLQGNFCDKTFHDFCIHTGRAGRSKNPIAFYTKDDMSIVNLLDKVYVCTSVGV